LGGTRHPVWPVLLIVFIKHFLYSLLFDDLQGDFADCVDKTMLYCLAKIGPSIGFAYPEEE
jgi:hypothetical protein